MANGTGGRCPSSSPPTPTPDPEQSFFGKVKSHVSALISNTPVKKWFGREDDPQGRKRDSGDEMDEMQPPPKRIKKYQDAQTEFLEPTPGPSGLKLANGGHKESDSEESTSGYSSVARIGSKEVFGSRESSKHSPLESSPTNSRSLFKGTANRSLFADRSLSPQLNSSLSSRRPSFNASTFNSPSFVDKTLSTKRILNSPFYSGRTVYGGALAHNKPLMRNTSQPVRIKPVNKNKSNDVGLGSTARKILETLEMYSTPVNDAKKIPVIKRSRYSGLQKYTGANPYILESSKKELQVPSLAQVQKQKERLQESTETVRQIIKSNKNYTLPPQDETGGGKIKNKLNVVRPALDPKPLEEVNLVPVALPITTLPKFDLKIPPPPKVEPVKVLEKSPLGPKEFKFSKPAVIAENLKNLVGINNYKFSEPLLKSKKVKNNGESSSLKIESTDDLTVKFKPPEGSWECSMCLIRNQADKARCLACETPRNKPNGKVAENSFGGQFKLQESEWECQVCLIRNKGNVLKCAACESPKSSEDKKVKSPEGLIKAPANTWQCSSCWVVNNNDSKCIACEATKPGKSEGFGSSFAKKENEWECSVCLVPNKAELSKCLCCDSPKPGSKEPVMMLAKGVEKKTISGFSFGLDPQACTFKFGIPKGTEEKETEKGKEPKPLFAEAAATSTFSFGIKPEAKVEKEPEANPLLKPEEKLPEKVEPAQVATFKFGAGPVVSEPAPVQVLKAEVTTAQATLPVFNFTSSQAQTQVQAAEPAKPFVFGAGAAAGSSLFGKQESQFKFEANGSFGGASNGVEVKTGGFNFGPPSQSFGSGFNFGSKVESNGFSFGGVKNGEVGQGASGGLGSAGAAASEPVKPVFSFGSNAASNASSGGFNFTSTAVPSAEGGFNFTGGSFSTGAEPTPFSAQAQAAPGGRKIRKAVRRTLR